MSDQPTEADVKQARRILKRLRKHSEALSAEKGGLHPRIAIASGIMLAIADVGEIILEALVETAEDDQR